MSSGAITLAAGREDGDVELWATTIDVSFSTVRLSDDTMRHREYKAAHRPASLRASSAAALAWSEPRADDVVLDPFCGAGTILFEWAHLGRYAMPLWQRLLLRGAGGGAESRWRTLQANSAREPDAGAIPLGRDASVDKIVTNLPWGLRYGLHGENRKLYPLWFREFSRVLKRAGCW